MKKTGDQSGQPGKKLGAFVVGAALVATSVLTPIPAAFAAPPPGQDFNVTQGDLEYIIKQVEIAEDASENATAIANLASSFPPARG